MSEQNDKLFQSDDKGNVYLLHIMILFLIQHQFVKPTVNNPESSRAASVYVFEDENKHRVRIVDAPGTENPTNMLRNMFNDSKYVLGLAKDFNEEFFNEPELVILRQSTNWSSKPVWFNQGKTDLITQNDEVKAANEKFLSQTFINKYDDFVKEVKKRKEKLGDLQGDLVEKFRKTVYDNMIGETGTAYKKNYTLDFVRTMIRESYYINSLIATMAYNMKKDKDIEDLYNVLPFTSVVKTSNPTYPYTYTKCVDQLDVLELGAIFLEEGGRKLDDSCKPTDSNTYKYLKTINDEIVKDTARINTIEKERNQLQKNKLKPELEQLKRKLTSQKLLTHFRNTLTFTKEKGGPASELDEWQEHLKRNPEEKGTPLINLDFFGNMYAIIMVPMFTDKKLIKARIDDIGYLNDTLFGKSRI